MRTSMLAIGPVAALLLLSAAGIVIFYLLSLINYLTLRRWHESALEQER